MTAPLPQADAAAAPPASAHAPLEVSQPPPAMAGLAESEAAAAVAHEAVDASPAQAHPAEPATPAVASAGPSLAETAALLAQHYPALFGPGPAKPIKLRVQADIQARTPGVFSKKALSIFLHRYTTSTAYLKALVAAPARVDLDGQAAGEIANEHREAAQLEVQRRREIVQARIAAQRQAHRHAAPRAEFEAGPAHAIEGGPMASTGDEQPGHKPGNERPGRPPLPPKGQRPHRKPSGQGQGSGHERQGPSHEPRPEQSQGPGPGGHERRNEGRSPARGPRPEWQGRRQDRPQNHPQERRQDGRQDRHPNRAPDRREGPHPGSGGQFHHGRGADGQPQGPAWPQDPAQRERALLLRAFEASPLTPANFSALKGLKLAEFEAQIALAQQDRKAQRAAAAAATAGAQAAARAASATAAPQVPVQAQMQVQVQVQVQPPPGAQG